LTTILILSTDLNPNQSLRQTLEANGFFVDIQAFNPDQFSLTIQSRAPDLIVLDLSRSNGKAPEICRAVRNVNTAPMVVLSTSNAPEMVAAVLDAGADDYLVKPVSNQILFASISKLTRRSSYNHGILPAVDQAKFS